MKKTILVLLVCFLCLTYTACGQIINNGRSDQANDTSSSESGTQQFSDSDLKLKKAEDADAQITLSSAGISISDASKVEVTDNTVTITTKGTYVIKGEADNVTVQINDTAKSGNVYLLLDGVNINNSFLPCINVISADKLIIQSLSDSVLNYTSEDSEQNGAIYSKDDITLNGTSNLLINSTLHGIVGNDDVKITGGKISITSGKIGIKANDSLRIGGGECSIRAGHDGVQVSNSDDNGYFYMEAGALSIISEYDGIDVTSSSSSFTGFISVLGGTLDVTAGGGSEYEKTANSQKGLRCSGNINIDEANITVSSADDALHSSSDINVMGGVITASSSDDGIHADNAVDISGGTIVVSKAHEGLEAYTVTLSGGEVGIFASDDGINAAGGSDTTSTDTRPGRWGASSATGILKISGGKLYVNAEGDGIDSNGSIYVSGGTVIIEGPTGTDNCAIDVCGKEDSVIEITGGTVLALGPDKTALNFNSGTQCSALVSLKGEPGTKITASDDAGFEFTASKTFDSAIYSSPYLLKGNKYLIYSNSNSTEIDFTSKLYYTDIER